MFPKQTKHSSGNNVRRSILMCLALSLLLSGGIAPSFAAVENDPALAKLEVKFFQHDYAKEDDGKARVERLEKLVYGEAKTGDLDARLKNLTASVNVMDPVAEAKGTSDQSSAPTQQASNPGSSRRTASAPNREDQVVEREQNIEGGSDYPAVTAIERKLLGKTFSGEPVAKRLDRLETKAFGKPSASDDLSDRVDRLKSRTGVDLASTPPAGSDWADDEDGPPPRTGGGDISFTPGTTTPYTSPPDEDGRTFSGRDLRQDVQRAFGRPATSSWGDSSGVIGGRGSYGMGSTASSDSGRGGSYGYNPPAPSQPSAARKIASANVPRVSPPISHATADSIPPPAPDVVHERDTAPPTAMGLSQQLAMLENELFRKTYTNETIPNRLGRLESTVFPSDHSTVGMSLPERVRRLTEAVGVAPDSNRRLAQRPASPAPSVDNDGMPQPAPPRSGFSKITNGLSNMLGGGGYGAYPTGSNLVNDPSTGLLYDRLSGNLIDPNTGAVVGNRTGRSMSQGSMGGYGGGFSNGLSPMGRSSGMGVGFGMGTGRGIGLGGGMMGGGMMGTGSGVGLWP